METVALVDTGATRLYLKRSLIKALGLRKAGQVESRTTHGLRRRTVFNSVRLEVMSRDGLFEVVEVDDDVPNLLGQIPLEYLGTGQSRLLVNPPRLAIADTNHSGHTSTGVLNSH